MEARDAEHTGAFEYHFRRSAKFLLQNFGQRLLTIVRQKAVRAHCLC